MTTPYRTAPATEMQRAPWWRRALCAVGSHSLYLVSHRRARCEHCGHETRERLSLYAHIDALDRACTRAYEGKATPDEARFVADYYRIVRDDHVAD